MTHFGNMILPAGMNDEKYIEVCGIVKGDCVKTIMRKMNKQLNGKEYTEYKDDNSNNEALKSRRKRLKYVVEDKTRNGNRHYKLQKKIYARKVFKHLN